MLGLVYFPPLPSGVVGRSSQEVHVLGTWGTFDKRTWRAASSRSHGAGTSETTILDTPSIPPSAQWRGHTMLSRTVG